MKPPSGFELAHPGLLIDKKTHYFFILTNQYIKYLKYKLNMNNETFAYYKNIWQLQ